jgi:hypothetical protein
MPISCSFWPDWACFGPLPRLRAYSCLRPLHDSLAHHPQVGQRKHHQQLVGVLGQTPIANLAMPELALDNPKRMLDLGADAGLDLLQLLFERVARSALVHHSALARHHGDVPVDMRVLRLNFLALVNAPVARVGIDLLFLPVQQCSRLGDVVRIGRRGRDGVHQARIGIHANVGLHAKVPLVAFFGLVHLGVAGTRAVLGGAGCRDQRGVDDGAGLEHQAAINQFGVDGSQYLPAQLVRFQQMPEAQDGAFIGQACDARIQVRKLPVQRDVVQGLFHGRVGVAEELLQQVNAQHHFGGKRRPSRLARGRMRCNQRQQLGPRDHQVHLIQELTFARAFGDQLESGAGKAHLFHGSTVSDHAVMGLTFADRPLVSEVRPL